MSRSRPAGSHPAGSNPAGSRPAGSRPAGDAALLIDADSPATLAAAIRSAGLDGVADALPGASTVLVITEPGSWDLSELARLIGALPRPQSMIGNNFPTVLPVVYDGQDLADVAGLTGMPVREVIARHAAAEYEVGWLGFAPGFGYLTGLDPVLSRVPRLATPRVQVPAGSVAIAGGLAAVYPVSSPGGWRLLGRTSASLWDQGRDQPSLLVPGQRVRFKPVDRLPDGQPQRARFATPAGRSAGTAWLEVIRPGPLATVQDLGRTGLGSIGVSPSGAADAASLTQANLLVGNPPGEAGIEMTLGRAAFRCGGPVRLAVTGAPAPVTATATGSAATAMPFSTAFDAEEGTIVSVGSPSIGLRSYLAVEGGIDVPAILGSRSADLHSGLGGGPLTPGTLLPVGGLGTAHADTAAEASGAAHAGTAAQASGAARVRLPALGQAARLRVVPGPRLDWFSPEALGILLGSTYQVSVTSNRTGLRLDGQRLSRAGERELPSEGLVTGSLQVPHDGRPILLLADHPTVGGYPVIAVVVSADIGLAAQLRPGHMVSFALA